VWAAWAENICFYAGRNGGSMFSETKALAFPKMTLWKQECR
jgi:hypothetical protein